MLLVAVGCWLSISVSLSLFLLLFLLFLLFFVVIVLVYAYAYDYAYAYSRLSFPVQQSVVLVMQANRIFQKSDGMFYPAILLISIPPSEVCIFTGHKTTPTPTPPPFNCEKIAGGGVGAYFSR